MLDILQHIYSSHLRGKGWETPWETSALIQ